MPGGGARAGLPDAQTHPYRPTEMLLAWPASIAFQASLSWVSDRTHVNLGVRGVEIGQAFQILKLSLALAG